MRLALVLALFVSLALPAAAQRCDTALAEADERYRAGYFDDVIERLSDCLDQNAFSSEERRRAYRLLGLSYIGKDRELDAREAVRSLLEVAPDYQPDPALDPPPFVQLVEEMNRPVRGPAPSPASVPAANQSVARTKGFMATFRAHGTNYSDDGGNLQGAGGNLALSYGVTPKLALVANFGGTGLEEVTPGESISLTSASLGGRYHLNNSRSKLVPFLGAGFVYQTATVELNGVSAEADGPGAELEGGLYYFFNPSWAVSVGVSTLLTSLDNEDLGVESFSATTVNYGVGISWTPGR